MIQAFEATKFYGRHRGIQGISLTVGVGETIGLFGQAGAGKTTLLDILSGCAALSSGSVVFCGYDMEDERVKAARQIGYVPEKLPLYKDMTVREQLLYAYRIKKLPSEEASSGILKPCTALGLKDCLEERVGTLSLFTRKKIALAQALLGDPELLLLDETDQGLDSEQTKELRKTVEALSGSRTVILALSELGEMAAACRRILVLEEGRITDDIQKPVYPSEKEPEVVALRVSGTEETVMPLLQRMYGVEKAECAGEREPFCTDFYITGKPETDLRPALFKVLSEAEIPILSLSRRKMTAEEMCFGFGGQAGHRTAREKKTKSSVSATSLVRKSKDLFKTMDKKGGAG